MAPILHFVRHAQGYHNLTTKNHGMHDPHLTPYGQQQCKLLQITFPYTDKIDLYVASPLKRTMETMFSSFGNTIKSRDFTVIALPEIQESSDLPCDTGSELEELQHEFEGLKIDWSRVKPGWNSKKGIWLPGSAEVRARCKVARQWLRARPESHVVVVLHGGVLHYLTDAWLCEEFVGTLSGANTVLI